MGAAMGIGYVQELVSRLTKTRLTEFNTSVNKTIVTNGTLFPLDQPIYVDAAHDITMAAGKRSFSNKSSEGLLIPKNGSLCCHELDEFHPIRSPPNG